MIMVLGPHKKKAEAKVEVEGRRRPTRAAERRPTREAEERAERDADRAEHAVARGQEPRPLREPRPRDRGLTRDRTPSRRRPCP